jgi:hypothetical protein
MVNKKRLACLGDLRACSYAQRMRCVWWNECYVETLARELKVSMNGGAS